MWGGGSRMRPFLATTLDRLGFLIKRALSVLIPDSGTTAIHHSGVQGVIGPRTE